MLMNFEELDATTRDFMVAEFDSEQAGTAPYTGKNLSATGRTAFVDIVRQALLDGNEASLAQALEVESYWESIETYTTKTGKAATRHISIPQKSKTFALSEFSTWYTRGLTRRLLDEGIAQVQVYRAAQPKWEAADCEKHEGVVVPTQVAYDGHRARYWPDPGNGAAFSIPFGPGCHHTIRRYR
jgi:hypothetical protein